MDYDVLLAEAVHFNEDVYRNVINLYRGPTVAPQLHLDFLDPTDEERQAGQALLDQSDPLASFREAGVILYPFDRSVNHRGTRFSDGSFGMWYGARAVETTAREVGFHMKRDLANKPGFVAGTRQVVRERQVYRVHLDALLIDLRRQVPVHSSLVDPSTDYIRTQPLGAYCAARHPGLVTRSARHASGENVAVFRRESLGPPSLHEEQRFIYYPAKKRLEVFRDKALWLTI